MKSYYERSDRSIKRLLNRSRKNADAYDGSIFGLMMPIPYWDEDAQFFEGVLQSRKEGKKPPFDLGQQVEVTVSLARPVDYSDGPRLKKDTRYYVRRVVYLGHNRWKMMLQDVGGGGYTYYNPKSFRLVPN